MDLHHNAPPGVLNIKEMKSLLIFASMGLKATILSFENLQRETLFLHEQSRKYKIFTQQFPLTSDEQYFFSVFSEEEPDLNSELEISVRKVSLLLMTMCSSSPCSDHRDCRGHRDPAAGEAADSSDDRQPGLL